MVVTPGTGVIYTLGTGLARGARASVVAAFGCTLGIVPHMLAASFGLARSMFALSGVFMLVTFVVFVGYGVFAAAVRSRVVSRPGLMTWMRRAFAGAFVALGARLALSR